MPVELWNPTPIGYYDVEDSEKNACYNDFLANKDLVSSLMTNNSWNDLISSTLTRDKNIATREEFKNFYCLIAKYAQKFCIETNHNLTKSPIFLANSWFNSTKKFGFQDWHNHYPFFISGVYYFVLKTSIDQDEGIHFRTHTLQDNITYHTDFSPVVYPYQPGRLIFFYSTLEHRVPFKKTDGERLSFSFNFGVVKSDV